MVVFENSLFAVIASQSFLSVKVNFKTCSPGGPLWNTFVHMRKKKETWEKCLFFNHDWMQQKIHLVYKMIFFRKNEEWFCRNLILSFRPCSKQRGRGKFEEKSHKIFVKVVIFASRLKPVKGHINTAIPVTVHLGIWVAPLEEKCIWTLL